MASKKKNQKKQAVSDEDSVEETEVESKPKSSFALLMADSDDAGSQSEPDSDADVKPVPTKKNVKKDPPKPEPKKGKKKKKGDEDDEDLEKMLAELDLEYQGKKQPEQKKEPAKPAENDEAEAEATDAAKKKDKKKKKKGKEDTVEKEVKEESPAPEREPEAEEPGEEAEESAAAAKKKKDKKKKKKAGEKEAAVEEPKEDEEDEGDKKKKGGKDDKKGKKGPSKMIVAAMQEALKKQKEEEERLLREEEERIRREEELERQRLEKERLEKEKKELKKQKEKEKREQLRAEGLLLTAKQKQKLNRAKASLEVWEATGIKVPDATEKKVRPGTRIRPKKEKPGEKEQSPSESAQPVAAPVEAEAPKENGTIVEEKVEPEEDVADSWELLDEDEKSNESEPAKPVEQQPVKQSEPSKPTQSEPAKISEPVKKAPPKKQISMESESETESDSDESDSDEEQKVREQIRRRREENEKKRSPDNLRAPVICVLGHVDTGKTKILDKLRRTNVQDSEAGGITQQIGATNVPLDAIREQTKIVKGFDTVGIKVPGLLIIDTPGHESFSNLRSRGSSLCDLAILVVDIMHGLEPQTLESINLLKSKKTPFVVALNKVDRLFEWQSNPKRDIRDVLKSQKPNTQLEFQQRSTSALLQLSEQGLNAKLFFENPDPKTYISVVPTSAITGDGMANLIAMVVELNQKLLTKRLMYSDELQATVLEVKAITGHGTTIDVILVNGTLRVGDEIVLAGFDGPIVTQIRALLMPKPMRELRVKNDYAEPKEVRAAQGVKIAAKDLEKAIAGLNLLVAKHPDEVDVLKEEVSGELKSALRTIKLQERGVYVQASTLGSLEALLEFLKTSEIPYSNVRIGPVAKRDVMKASIMLEHDSQYAVILAFDVRVERDAQEMADSVGVKIFQADIIYHLFDKFTKYREELKQKKRDEFKHIAVFPCKLRILPQFVFNSRDPIVVGVMVESGIVKEGTPLCVPSKDFVEIGVVSTIEINHKAVDVAKKGQEVCIKIENVSGDAPKMYGRHFDHQDLLVSKISRQSIDACKDYFRDDLTKADWQLMIELKKLFQIL